MEDFHVTLRRLTVRDARFVDVVLGSEQDNIAASRLGAKSHALLQIGALIALDAAPQSYGMCLERARLAGATAEQLVAAISVVVVPRVVSAAPKLGLALGDDRRRGPRGRARRLVTSAGAIVRGS